MTALTAAHLLRSHSEDRQAPTGPVLVRVGRSVRGSPVWFESLGAVSPRPRVLIVAGQHGDEPQGPRALRLLLDEDRAELRSLGLSIGWISESNPDGLALGRRENDEGRDLNRDHIALAAPETRAVHAVLRTWTPDVVIDLHAYPSRRTAALRRGWVLEDSVLLATTTHPGVRPLAEGLGARFLPEVLGALEAVGVSAGEYRLFQPTGRIRRSSLQTSDLRNGAALRYGAFTILLEGRSPRDEEGAPDRRRLLEAQRLALREVLRWIARRRTAFTRSSALPAAGAEAPVRARWVPSAEPMAATVRASDGGPPRRVLLGGVYGEVEVTRRIRLPSAYAVPFDRSALIDLLLRQGFEYRVARDDPEALAAGVDERDLVFPIDQRGGEALAAWVEPSSEFGPAESAPVSSPPAERLVARIETGVRSS